MDSQKTITQSCFRQHRNGTRTGIGSFEASLYETYYKADYNNRCTLVKAFPDYFNPEDKNL
jgi:hypothetical protein